MVVVVVSSTYEPQCQPDEWDAIPNRNNHRAVLFLRQGISNRGSRRWACQTWGRFGFIKGKKNVG